MKSAWENVILRGKKLAGESGEDPTGGEMKGRGDFSVGSKAYGESDEYTAATL